MSGHENCCKGRTAPKTRAQFMALNYPSNPDGHSDVNNRLHNPREGSLVDVMYGSANRDPAVFSDPETFRVDRPLSEGMAFGSGIHFCLGAALARTEARIALNALLDRYARIELGAEPAVRQRVAFATLNFVSLPLVLHER